MAAAGRWDAAMWQVARAGDGIFTWTQARAAGIPKWAIARTVKKLGWRRVHPAVYSTREELSWKERVRAALLWAGPGAIASHSTAARLHGIEGYAQDDTVHIAVPPSRHPVHRDVAVHRGKTEFCVERAQETDCSSIPRTLIDLARGNTEEALEITVNATWHGDRAATLHRIEFMLGDIGAQGRHGVAILKRGVRHCWRRGVPLDSPAEVICWRFLHSHRLPLPAAGELTFDEEGLLLPDFLYAARALAIEVDGFKAHGQKEHFERDSARRSRQAAQGVCVLHLTPNAIRDEPQKVLSRVRRALRACPPRRLAPVFVWDEPVPPEALEAVQPLVRRWEKFARRRAHAMPWGDAPPRPTFPPGC